MVQAVWHTVQDAGWKNIKINEEDFKKISGLRKKGGFAELADSPKFYLWQGEKKFIIKTDSYRKNLERKERCVRMIEDILKYNKAFVEKKADGDRDFSFYRNPGADMMLRTEELQEQILKDTRIFHFGTLSMTDEPVRSATRHAIETAKANGALLSFDPNIREPLWQSMEEAKRQTAYGMEVCDVLKILDNEIRWFTGEEDFDRGVDKLWREYHIP